MDHGIARYVGMTQRTYGDAVREYLQLDFAGADKIFLPADQVGRITRYSGAPAPGLSKLSGREWAATDTIVDRVGFPHGYQEKYHGAPHCEQDGERADRHRLWKREGGVDHTRRSITVSLWIDHRDGDGHRAARIRKESQSSTTRAPIAETRSWGSMSCAGRTVLGRRTARTGRASGNTWSIGPTRPTSLRRGSLSRAAECHVKAGGARDFVYRGRLPAEASQ